jgi:hydroxymethylbilane synthase
VDKITIVCRASKLSLIQAELVRSKIIKLQPETDVVIRGMTSKGDRLVDLPLSSLNGMDFFTADIFQELREGKADIAVHSLKDMSSEHFFSHNAFAVIERNDHRDVAIFNENIIQKLINKQNIVIGTSSPRREEMVVKFLKKALPQLHDKIEIETKPIRGNVDTRLQKLDNGDFDGIILATAGLNRLLTYGDKKGELRQLLDTKKIIILPLIECTPAPCQGMIVAEGNPDNTAICALLEKISDDLLMQTAVAEKSKARTFGSGCSQKFGVTTISTRYGEHIYAAGIDGAGNTISEWTNLPQSIPGLTHIFATNEVMKDFFDYQWSEKKHEIATNHVFVANPKIAQNRDILQSIKHKNFWAAGSKTWYDLAKAGIWVTGSTDGMGFEYLESIVKMPLIQSNLNDITILSHQTGAQRWKLKGIKAVGYYDLIAKNSEAIIKAIQEADMIFWSSYSQFKAYKRFAKTSVIHSCAGGETATLLIESGIKPIIFPTIKSFEQWRTNIQ